MSIEKRAFLRWKQRTDVENYDLILKCVHEYDSILNNYGYEWIKKSIMYGYNSRFEIEYEKIVGNGLFSYINVLFDKYGSLSFQIYFAIRRDKEPFEFLRDGQMCRYQSEGWPAHRWGARWFDLNKPRKFEKDWKTVIKTIPDIIEFLERKTPHRHIWDSMAGKDDGTIYPGVTAAIPTL